MAAPAVGNCSAGPLSVSDIEIMQSYARRVRSICLRNRTPVDLLAGIDPMILGQLPILLDNKPLFPRLRKLEVVPYVHNHHVVCSSYLSIFFSPSLQDIVFGPKQSQKALYAHTIWWFFRNMDNMPPSSLQVKSIEIGVSLTRHVITSLSKLTRLERLQLSPRHDTALNFSLVQELADLASLQYLSLSVRAESKKMPVRSMYTNPTFSALTTLCMYSDVNTTTGMFLLFDFPALETLNLYRRIADPPAPFQPESWETFLVQLPQWLPRLRAISMNIADQENTEDDEDEVEEDSPISLSWSCFTPLLLLSLTHLSIQLPMVDTLSYQDFVELTSSSSRLESLKIKVRTVSLHRSVFTEIVTRLPCLKELCLSVDLYDVCVNWLSEIPRSTHKLERLIIPRMKDSRVNKPPLNLERMFVLAQYVDSLFPHLKFLSCQADCDFWKPDGTCNYFLHSLVRGLQYARTMERARNQ
ncbi:hypothetical protein CVT24_002902 [Panaeolus cyanescens]|uniref:F-box domain-containing protein n=1 Tax=Panaeolus cyanescens TaxID=181874 RepID=A0A409W8N3_9AGAR|nr:hypothetical protein CVT24_002902 [Panaeolus cyanescens]